MDINSTLFAVFRFFCLFLSNNYQQRPVIQHLHCSQKQRNNSELQHKNVMGAQKMQKEQSHEGKESK